MTSGLALVPPGFQLRVVEQSGSMGEMPSSTDSMIKCSPSIH